MVATRGIQALRTLQGLLALTQRHAAPEIEKACEIAHSYGAYRLANVRRLIRHHAPKQEPLEFTEEHPMIRHISVYGDLVRTAIEQQQTTRRKLP
jgi:hypothetical protein